jgi:hypothetical protein
MGSEKLHFTLHPNSFASIGVTADDVEDIVDLLIGCGPERVTIIGFDAMVAASIADQLVCHEMKVHVDGSGEAAWRTPADVYAQCIARINGAINAAGRG